MISAARRILALQRLPCFLAAGTQQAQFTQRNPARPVGTGDDCQIAGGARDLDPGWPTDIQQRVLANWHDYGYR
ncbi:hypothetical protein ACWEO2_01950 [Nocardia sp. NPDC004278]